MALPSVAQLVEADKLERMLMPTASQLLEANKLERMLSMPSISPVLEALTGPGSVLAEITRAAERLRAAEAMPRAMPDYDMSNILARIEPVPSPWKMQAEIDALKARVAELEERTADPEPPAPIDPGPNTGQYL
jgi:hypothetical protein